MRTDLQNLFLQSIRLKIFDVNFVKQSKPGTYEYGVEIPSRVLLRL